MIADIFGESGDEEEEEFTVRSGASQHKPTDTAAAAQGRGQGQLRVSSGLGSGQAGFLTGSSCSDGSISELFSVSLCLWLFSMATVTAVTLLWAQAHTVEDS